MRVLLIDNYDSFTFNLKQLVEELELCELEVLPYNKVDERVIKSFDKFIISPGPGIPSDFPKLQHYISKFYDTKDILGICLGFEAIALAFGGEIISSGRVFHGLAKTTLIADKENYIFQGVPDNFKSGCYHSWVVKKESFPKDLKITAVADDGIIMALSHNQYNVVGFQYHPESIMTKYGRKMVENWLKGNAPKF